MITPPPVYEPRFSIDLLRARLRCGLCLLAAVGVVMAATGCIYTETTMTVVVVEGSQSEAVPTRVVIETLAAPVAPALPEASPPVPSWPVGMAESPPTTSPSRSPARGVDAKLLELYDFSSRYDEPKEKKQEAPKSVCEDWIICRSK